MVEACFVYLIRRWTSARSTVTLPSCSLKGNPVCTVYRALINEKNCQVGCCLWSLPSVIRDCSSCSKENKETLFAILNSLPLVLSFIVIRF